ncbi:MAG: hypothetical protein L6R40_004265 [Gallowayella cf. fulva]|nr:MAG: hypothetical protein L6R40_004265 [Xanthomendoza cf. fulva]
MDEKLPPLPPPPSYTSVAHRSSPGVEATSPTPPSSRQLKRRHDSGSPPLILQPNMPSEHKESRLLPQMAINGWRPWIIPMESSLLSNMAPQTCSPGDPVSSKASSSLTPRNSLYNAGLAMQARGMVRDEKGTFFARWNNMNTDGMTDEEKEVRDKYRRFDSTIDDITVTERLSGVKPASAEKISAYRAEYERHNEATFLRIMFPLLMKDGYHVVKDSTRFSQEQKDLIKAEDLIYKDFLTNEGIIMTLDTDILRHTIPSTHPDTDLKRSWQLRSPMTRTRQ